MNRHFTDVRYYIRRAVAAASAGIVEVSSTHVARARRLVGLEPEPQPTRAERWRAIIAELPGRVAARLAGVRGGWQR